MTSTMYAQRAQTGTSSNEEAQAVAAALGFKGLSTASNNYCARRLSVVQPPFVSAHDSECETVRGSRCTSMQCGEPCIQGVMNVAHLARIALSLALHGFRLRSTCDGVRIEPLKDQDG